MMSYRSERFAASDMPGLEQVWRAVDTLEASGVPISTEVMAGTSYRRQLQGEVITRFGRINYLLQVVADVPQSDDGNRISADYYIDEARRILGSMDLPGRPLLDKGVLKAPDRPATQFGFRSSGDAQNDIVEIYPPWVSTRWSEASRKCMFFCGIRPPRPKRIVEQLHMEWDERYMRKGYVVFDRTPDTL